MLLTLLSFVYLPSSNVKPPRHAPFDATLAQRPAEHGVGAGKRTSYII